jgi:two-component system, NarL family, nitrate/nitrite response regulator NarL
MIAKGISVFLVAANRLLRETLAKVLSNKGGFNVLGVSASIPESHATLSDSGAEVLVIDSIFPGSSEQRPCEFLPKSPGPKIVLIDMDDDPDVFIECVRAGARGYLLKEASAAEVMCAIRSVSHGHAVFPPQICASLLRDVSSQPPGPLLAPIRCDSGLTRRQQQLVPLLAKGLTNKEIASYLNLSEQTIKNHVHNILRRVGVNNRFQVIDSASRPVSLRS